VWEESGSSWNDEPLVERGVLSLVRANPAASYQPRIIARPASPWEVNATDQEVRKSIEAAIVMLNHGSENGRSPSLVMLSSRQITMYCMRDSLGGVGSDRQVSLNCSAAKMRYSFGYSGPERHEKEAEMILSTFEWRCSGEFWECHRPPRRYTFWCKNGLGKNRRLDSQSYKTRVAVRFCP